MARNLLDARAGRKETSAQSEHAVARFYSDLVFPSRTSHPEYTELVPKEHGERIGDFGCGQSLFYDALRNYKPTPVFLDLSLNALRTIDYGHRLRGDLYRLPLQNASFGRIFCVGVVHHLSDPERALREIARVLTPGGVLVLGVYAPGTIQAHLRRLYERSPWKLWRRGVFLLTQLMIQTRYRSRGTPLTSEDAAKRARDFLEVPLVRYTHAAFYATLGTRLGLKHVESRRISAMNLLFLRRS